MEEWRDYGKYDSNETAEVGDVVRLKCVNGGKGEEPFMDLIISKVYDVKDAHLDVTRTKIDLVRPHMRINSGQISVQFEILSQLSLNSVLVHDFRQGQKDNRNSD